MDEEAQHLDWHVESSHGREKCAVVDVVGAGDVLGPWRYEEGDEIGDIVSGADTSQRNVEASIGVVRNA